MKTFQNVDLRDEKTRFIIGKCTLAKLDQDLSDTELRQVVAIAFRYEVPQLKEILEKRDRIIDDQIMREKYHISNTSGKWLVNGRSYEQLNESEKKFFNDFMRETRINR